MKIVYSKAPKTALDPSPDEVLITRRGGERRMYSVYDLKNHTSGGRTFNLQAGYSGPVVYGDVTPPPLYAQRFVTGNGKILKKVKTTSLFLCPQIERSGVYCFWPVCLSVIHSLYVCVLKL
ncbi:hypothetical protein DPMN_172939 [Dreissena polymorpha]|uniref:Uncharacterized protein n=1 Tax=Dreissena polymorpha TaxID=45954 RepID=A0A9D4E2H4_DREPO|nr:hypothetical protein DPMN_172939 [Dreissena polymorpha]